VTYPHTPQPGPRPGPPPGGFRPGPVMPPPSEPAAQPDEWDENVAGEPAGTPTGGDGTGHPAVDAVLRSLANAAQLAPADQIAEYEAAHRVLQETLSSIDG
jgi:hypothetical protein